MPTNQFSSTIDEPEMGYGQLLGILMRRAAWVGGAVAVAVGGAIAFTLREEPVYQSSMQLLIEPNYQKTVDITPQQIPEELLATSPIDYATQLNLMRSSSFIEETIDQLLAIYPEFCNDSENKVDCINQVQEDLNLEIVVEGGRVPTRIVDIAYKDNDEAVVQAFLETLGDIYLTYNEENQQQRLEDGLAIVNQQIEDAQTDLEGSRQALKQFRESENLIAPEQQALAVADSLSEIKQAEIELANESLDAQAEYQALQTQLNTDPQTALVSARLSQSARYQNLLNSLQETELALAQRLAIYAEADPGVQDLKSQRQEQVALLKGEVARVLGSLPEQLNLGEAALLNQGQFGETDLTLASSLVQAQVRLQRITARRTGLVRARQRLETEFNDFPGLIAEFERIQPEIEIQQQSLVQLLQIREQLSNELAQGGFKWDIVEAPQLGEKIAPQPIRNLALGVVAGVFIGGALAFGREAVDKVVRTSDALQRQVELPILGTLPEMTVGTLDVFPVQVSTNRLSLQEEIKRQLQPFRDAVDLIYNAARLKSSQPLASLMVSSAGAGEGKTTLAVGLAMSAARAHQRVLLIDTNLRQPSIHKRLGISNALGLSTYLQPQANSGVPSKVIPTSVSLAGANLDVLPAGPIPEDPVKVLSSLRMQRLLSSAENHYDLVILDAPAILGVADTLQLASLCKGVVMISRLDQTTQTDLTEATALLSQLNTIGMVVNEYQGKRSLGSKTGDRGRQDLPYQNGHTTISPEEPVRVGPVVRTMKEWVKVGKQSLISSAIGIGLAATPAIVQNLPIAERSQSNSTSAPPYIGTEINISRLDPLQSAAIILEHSS